MKFFTKMLGILLLIAVIAACGFVIALAITGYLETQSFDFLQGGVETILQYKDSSKFSDVIMICGLGAGALLLFFWANSSTKNAAPKKMLDKKYDVDSDKKGSARWLSDKEIDTYFPKCTYDDAINRKINGFVVQTKEVGNKTYANYKSGVHCLIIGTTGSGKTIRFVIPTMQLLARSASKPSVVVTDPKGELYATQSKLYKERGYDVLTLNLREPLKRSSCWNPCHIAYSQYQEGLVQKDKIKFHNDKVDNYKASLKIAEDHKLFHEQWYEFGGYAFANLKSAMIEAERVENSMKSLAQESISDLVQTIYAESAKKANDPFWTKSASSLVEGLLLAMLEDSEIPELGITGERFNLATVSSTLSLRVDSLKSYFAVRDVSSNAKRKAQGPLSAPTGGTQESIISTAMADLSSFADPDIQYITCNNDIDFKDIGRKPTVVFLIIPDEKENKHIFASLFITQAYKSLVELASGREGVGGACPHQVNFIIDEFANMPVIPGMDNKITVARSRGISFMLIIQALSQLRAKYGPDVAEIIKSNCNLQVFLATNDNETAEYFSKICGEKTIKDINVSRDGKTGQENESYSLSARALITPSELLTLPEGTSIAKLLRTQPAKVKQTEFWHSKAYYKGEQVIETKWNPKLFIFDEDGFYDIVNRNRSDAQYVVDDINKYTLEREEEAAEEVEEYRNVVKPEEDIKAETSPTVESIVNNEENKISSESSKEDDDFFNSLFEDEKKEETTTDESEKVEEEKTEEEKPQEEEFNFDDLEFNFDAVLSNDESKDEVASVEEIMDTALVESFEENDMEIDYDALSGLVDFGRKNKHYVDDTTEDNE